MAFKGAVSNQIQDVQDSSHPDRLNAEFGDSFLKLLVRYLLLCAGHHGAPLEVCRIRSLEMNRTELSEWSCLYAAGTY